VGAKGVTRRLLDVLDDGVGSVRHGFQHVGKHGFELRFLVHGLLKLHLAHGGEVAEGIFRIVVGVLEQDEGEDVSLLGRKMGEFLADFGGGEGAEASSLLSDTDLLLERGDHAGEFLLGLNGQKVLNASMLGGNFGLELERSGIYGRGRGFGRCSGPGILRSRLRKGDRRDGL